jgi:tellurite resistance protein TehA-like permease
VAAHDGEVELGPGRGAELDDPAWFGAVMGTGAVAIVATMNPGGWAGLDAWLDAVGLTLFVLALVAFVGLVVRSFVLGDMARTFRSRMRSPVTGAAYATIPGSLNVLAAATTRLWPELTAAPAGWWSVAVLAGLGTALGLWLTVEFFVSAFEHPGVDAREITGVWFVPETVVLLGALLFSQLADVGPPSMAENLGAAAFALLGAGGLLFAVTATIFVNRLILHPHGSDRSIPSLWIMISPLSVTSLALQSVARDVVLLGGRWSDAVLETAAMLAAMLWGFALWWTAAAATITRHAGHRPLTGTAADWAFVFPPAALVIATLTLGRVWNSGMVEYLGAALAACLLAVWLAVGLRSLAAIRADLPGRQRA